MTQLNFENLHLLKESVSGRVFKSSLIGSVLVEINTDFRTHLSQGACHYIDSFYEQFASKGYLTKKQVDTVANIITRNFEVDWKVVSRLYE